MLGIIYHGKIDSIKHVSVVPTLLAGRKGGGGSARPLFFFIVTKIEKIRCAPKTILILNTDDDVTIVELEKVIFRRYIFIRIPVTNNKWVR